MWYLAARQTAHMQLNNVRRWALLTQSHGPTASSAVLRASVWSTGLDALGWSSFSAVNLFRSGKVSLSPARISVAAQRLRQSEELHSVCKISPWLLDQQAIKIPLYSFPYPALGSCFRFATEMCEFWGSTPSGFSFKLKLCLAIFGSKWKVCTWMANQGGSLRCQWVQTFLTPKVFWQARNAKGNLIIYHICNVYFCIQTKQKKKIIRR